MRSAHEGGLATDKLTTGRTHAFFDTISEMSSISITMIVRASRWFIAFACKAGRSDIRYENSVCGVYFGILRRGWRQRGQAAGCVTDRASGDGLTCDGEDEKQRSRACTG